MPLGQGREYLAHGKDMDEECFPGHVLIVVGSPLPGVSG